MAHPVTPGHVDAHVHFWDTDLLSYPWLAGDAHLNRPFLPGDLASSARAPESVVVVQADCRPEQSLREATWLADLARDGAPVLAVVAQAPLELGAAATGHLARLRQIPLVTGVRRLIQDEQAGFATQPELIAGVRLLADAGLTLDLCIRHHQLPEAVALVERVPEVTFVLDHLGKPPAAWSDGLARLAAQPGTYCKLSGLVTEADAATRTALNLVPYLKSALDTFGPHRCMFGSDWPVMTTAARYEWWLGLVLEAIADLSDTEQAMVMHGTARTVYAPGPPRARPGSGIGSPGSHESEVPRC